MTHVPYLPSLPPAPHTSTDSSLTFPLQVTSLLELPLVTVGDSLLTVRTVAPAQVTAGIAFTYSLQVWEMCGAGECENGRRISPRSSPFVCELKVPMETPIQIYRSKQPPLLPDLALPLQIQNFSHHVVELAVSLQESHGFVLSGERTQVSGTHPL